MTLLGLLLPLSTSVHAFLHFSHRQTTLHDLFLLLTGQHRIHVLFVTTIRIVAGSRGGVARLLSGDILLGRWSGDSGFFLFFVVAGYQQRIRRNDPSKLMRDLCFAAATIRADATG